MKGAIGNPHLDRIQSFRRGTFADREPEWVEAAKLACRPQQVAWSAGPCFQAMRNGFRYLWRKTHRSAAGIEVAIDQTEVDAPSLSFSEDRDRAFQIERKLQRPCKAVRGP